MSSPYDAQYSTLRARITAVANQYGLRPEIAIAQLWQESRFKTNARSGVGAAGIAQFMPAPVPAPAPTPAPVPDARTVTALQKVHPRLAEAAFAIVAQAAKAGYRLTVVQGLRTYEQQAALYAQGRTRQGPVVTRARAGSSWHNFGLAVDFAFVDAKGKPSWCEKTFNYKLIGQWAALCPGVVWGGNWKRFTDKPHIELTGKLTLAQARAAYTKGGLPAVWKLI